MNHHRHSNHDRQAVLGSMLCDENQDMVWSPEPPVTLPTKPPSPQKRRRFERWCCCDGGSWSTIPLEHLGIRIRILLLMLFRCVIPSLLHGENKDSQKTFQEVPGRLGQHSIGILTEDLDQLRDLLIAIGRVTALDRIAHTRLNVLLQNDLPDLI